MEDFPEPITMLTRFNVAVGACCGCGRRLQGRHPEQSAAAPGLGPRAIATAVWLHKTVGMRLAKICTLYATLGLSRSPRAHSLRRWTAWHPNRRCLPGA